MDCFAAARNFASRSGSVNGLLRCRSQFRKGERRGGSGVFFKKERGKMSIVSICNKALSQIGDEGILSLDDERKAARYCKMLYDPCRKFVLRSYPWRFALKRYMLAPLKEKPLFGYDYRFVMPKDCLRVWKVAGNKDFTVEGGMILYNADVFRFIGVSDVADPSMFDSMFEDVLAARLASELAVPLTASPALRKELAEMYEYRVAQARTASAFEGKNEKTNVTDWLEARL